jgi:hypothetical protein
MELCVYCLSFLRQRKYRRNSSSVQTQPGLDPLIEDELHVLVAAPGESKDEGPRLAQFTGFRVDHPLAQYEICHDFPPAYEGRGG